MNEKFNIETKADLVADEAGEISGLAWVWRTADRTRDRIVKGAFKGAKLPLPMLDAHDQSRPIGVWHDLQETEHGLEVRGTLSVKDVERAREYRALIRDGAVRGLSIGGIFSETKRLPNGEREVRKVELLEISPVAIPAHAGAQITSYKSSQIHSHEGNNTMDNETIDNDDLDTGEADNITERVNELKALLTTTTKSLDELRADNHDLRKKLGRPGVIRTPAAEDDATVERKAFTDYLRSGFVTKSVMTESSTSGGYVAPATFTTELQRAIVEISPMDRVATSMTISAPSVTLPKVDFSTSVSWLEAENDPATETSMTYGQIEIAVEELAAYTDISDRLLNDAEVNVERELLNDFSLKIAQKTNHAFLLGTGVGMPSGLLANEDISTATAGNTDGFNIAELIGFFHSMPTEYRRNAAWMMNPETVGLLRQISNTYGSAASLWGERLTDAAPATFLGKPIIEAVDMPTVAAGNIAIAFGDFGQTYRIVRNGSITVVRDGYTQALKGVTRFVVRQRIGGGVKNPNPMKFFQMAAS